MNFNWIEPSEMGDKIIIFLESVRVGHKPFWLIDEIKSKYLNRFQNEIKKDDFCSGIYLNELLVWYPQTLSTFDRNNFPIIFDIPRHELVDFDNILLNKVNSIVLKAQKREKFYSLSAEDEYL